VTPEYAAHIRSLIKRSSSKPGNMPGFMPGFQGQGLPGFPFGGFGTPSTLDQYSNGLPGPYSSPLIPPSSPTPKKP
jgi:hypothetical protein